MQNKKHTLFILAEKLPIHTMLMHYLFFTLEAYFFKGKQNKTPTLKGKNLITKPR